MKAVNMLNMVDRQYHGVQQIPNILPSERDIPCKTIMTKQVLLNITYEILVMLE